MSSPSLYPEIEPSHQGMLDVGDGHRVYWEVCGNPAGKPAIAMHGGPGSGCTPWWRRLFNPDDYRIVLFDQRGCGRSHPHAADAEAGLSANTTHHLIADVELLRAHLAIDRWLVLGGSWGSTLGLAYAEMHPDRVTELVLFSVTTTGSQEVRWITRDVGRLFPEAWDRFLDGLPEEMRDGNLAEAYSRLLEDPDPAVHEKAARDWCDWEKALVGARDDEPTRFDDARFHLGFARLVTHYWRHAAWLDDSLVRGAAALAGIPAVLIHGRCDLGSPMDVPSALARAWPEADLVIVEGAGHGGTAAFDAAIVRATDGFGRS